MWLTWQVLLDDGALALLKLSEDHLSVQLWIERIPPVPNGDATMALTATWLCVIERIIKAFLCCQIILVCTPLYLIVHILYLRK